MSVTFRELESIPSSPNNMNNVIPDFVEQLQNLVGAIDLEGEEGAFNEFVKNLEEDDVLLQDLIRWIEFDVRQKV